MFAFFVCLLKAVEQSEEEINRLANEPYFDGKSKDYMTNVHSQGDRPICWAYSVAGAAEINMVKKGISGLSAKQIELSEDNIAILVAERKPEHDPVGYSSLDTSDKIWKNGNQITTGVECLLQWNTPRYFYGYEERTCERAEWVARNVESIDPNDPMEIKRAIVKYGSVTVRYDSTTSKHNYIRTLNYDPNTLDPHGVLYVGWDDNLNKELYTNGGYIVGLEPASTNGGWQMKNSWGVESGLEGYYWISYDSPIYEVFGVDMVKNDNEKHLYYYDGTLDKLAESSDVNKIVGVIFEPRCMTLSKKECIDSINVCIRGKNVRVEAFVYANVKSDPAIVSADNNNPVSDKLIAQASKQFKNPGYYTLEFESKPELNPSESFSVVVKVYNEKGDASILSVRESSTNDRCYKNDGDKWIKMEPTPKIKVITKTYLRDKPFEKDLFYCNVQFSESFKIGEEWSDKKPVVSLEGRVLTEGVEYELVINEKTKVPEDTTDIYRTVVGRREVLILGKGEYKNYKKRESQIMLSFTPDASEFSVPSTLGSGLWILVPSGVTKPSQIHLPDEWSFVGISSDAEFPGLADTGSCKRKVTLKYNGPDANLYKMHEGISTDIYLEGRYDNMIDLKDAVVVLSDEEVTYDGSIKCPSVVSVTVKGYVLSPNVHYRIKYINNINVGTAYVSVIGLENGYYGFKRTSFKINRANDNRVVFFDATENVPKAMTKYGTPEFQYSMNQDFAAPTSKPTTDGRYYVRVYVPESSNYEAFTSNEHIQIDYVKANKDDNCDLKHLSVDEATLVPPFNSQNTDYTIEIQNDLTEVNVNVEVQAPTSSYDISGNANLTPENPGKITIKVTAENKNTKTYTITINRKIVKPDEKPEEKSEVVDPDVNTDEKSEVVDPDVNPGEKTEVNPEVNPNENSNSEDGSLSTGIIAAISVSSVVIIIAIIVVVLIVVIKRRRKFILIEASSEGNEFE